MHACMVVVVVVGNNKVGVLGFITQSSCTAPTSPVIL